MTFNLTVLGSSSALPTSKRFPTAHVLNVHEQFYLIDCGEGTQIQLRRQKIKFGKINHVFISHLHGDHVFGLFGLLSTYNLLNRKASLHIYGNPGLQDIIRFFMTQFSEKLSFNIVLHSIDSKSKTLVFEDKHITVISLPLKHRIPTLGYIFREKERPLNIRKEKILQHNIPLTAIKSIIDGKDWVTGDGDIIPNKELTLSPYKPRSFAFCTDTLYRESIIPDIRDVDLLYHESTFLEVDKKLAKETYHSTAMQAATLAKKASVKKLLIGHFSSRYKHIEEFVNEARSIFSETFSAEEGETHIIEMKRLENA